MQDKHLSNQSTLEDPLLLRFLSISSVRASSYTSGTLMAFHTENKVVKLNVLEETLTLHDIFSLLNMITVSTTIVQPQHYEFIKFEKLLILIDTRYNTWKWLKYIPTNPSHNMQVCITQYGTKVWMRMQVQQYFFFFEDVTTGIWKWRIII
jgi:hypothetical protein